MCESGMTHSCHHVGKGKERKGRRATAQFMDPPTDEHWRSESGSTGTRTLDLSSAQLGHGFHCHSGRSVRTPHCTWCGGELVGCRVVNGSLWHGHARLHAVARMAGEEKSVGCAEDHQLQRDVIHQRDGDRRHTRMWLASDSRHFSRRVPARCAILSALSVTFPAILSVNCPFVDLGCNIRLITV